MSTKKIEVHISEEDYAVVKKMAEKGIGRGRAERKPVTVAEMCAALIHTGAFRRIAANKWAKAHAGDKPKKPKAAKKSASKKPAAKKSPAKAAKKPAPARKPKAAKKSPAPAPAAQGEPMKPSLPAQTGGVLD